MGLGLDALPVMTTTLELLSPVQLEKVHFVPVKRGQFVIFPIGWVSLVVSLSMCAIRLFTFGQVGVIQSTWYRVHKW
jgi:hypothetical protein